MVFMRFIGFCATVVNWGLICTTTPFVRDNFHPPFVFFMGLFIIQIVKLIIYWLIPDSGSRTNLILRQGEWQREKLYAHISHHVDSCIGLEGADMDQSMDLLSSQSPEAFACQSATLKRSISDTISPQKFRTVTA